MKKPQMKAELGIIAVDWNSHMISTDCTPDMATTLADWGRVQHMSALGDSRHFLWVDSRFDFAEVVAYVRALANGGAA